MSFYGDMQTKRPTSFDPGIMNVPLFCSRPFEWMEILACDPDSVMRELPVEVELTACSIGWGDMSLARIPHQALPHLDLASVWNNSKAQAIRQSIFDGSFRFCTRCPRLRDQLDPVVPVEQITEDFHRQLLRDKRTTTPGPKVLKLSHDYSCNLKCPSCRRQVIQIRAGHPMLGRLLSFNDRIRQFLHRGVREVILAGQGDPFGSYAYWALLKGLNPEEFPRLMLYLHTNGLGFVAEKYQSLRIKEQIQVVHVSVDATTPLTYKVIRGGSWARLQQTLAYLLGLCEAGRLQLHLSFVIQAKNWREMEDFVVMARRYRASAVIFYGLGPYGLWAGEQYAAEAVHLPEHPEHAAFREALARVRALHTPTIHVDI